MDDSDREGLHSANVVQVLLIGRKLVSHPKVELPYAVVAGVVVPHGCKDLTNLVEVLLDRWILDRLTLRRQKTETDALGENMEERNEFLNVFDVEVDLQPAAEVPPLAPGGGVFLEEGCGETLGDRLLCSMVVRFCLRVDGRGSRRQCLLYGKCVRKWEINCRSGR